jgi:DNA-binding CsgD family transcriptional regulator
MCCEYGGFMSEIWKDIPNYEKRFKISNYGRVYSYLSNNYKKATLRKDGYYIVSLDGKTHLLHRLVLLTFVGLPPTPLHECRHFPDFDKSNNNLNNLQWSTHLDNLKDKDNYLNDEVIIEIKNQLLKLKNYQKVADLFNISREVVSQIARNDSYKNIGPDLSVYNFDSRNLKSDDFVRKIKIRINEGKSAISVMREFGINRSYFYRIKNNELRSQIKI